MNPVRWARLTVTGVFLLGLIVVVGPALWNADSLFRDPFTSAVERTTVETYDASGNRTGSEVTTKPAGGSLVERSLAAGGVLLLRLAVVSAAAYLAGALVYRTMSGTFPSEIGGVKFAEDAAAALANADANIEEVRRELSELTARLDVMRQTAADGAAEVTKLGKRVDTASQSIERLGGAVVALGEELQEVRRRGQ